MSDWLKSAQMMPYTQYQGDPLMAAHEHGMPVSWPSSQAPAINPVVYAATITVDASIGNIVRVTLGGNVTFAPLLNPADGESITFELKQDATGSRLVTWSSSAGGFSFGGGAAPTLTTTAAKTDRVKFVYNAAANKWWYDGSNLNF